MNLYLISQTNNKKYDTYDSAVVAAESETAARHTHPRKAINDEGVWITDSYTWVKSPNEVRATYLGVAAAEMKPGVILASFNAG